MTDYRQLAAMVLAKCAANDPWFPKGSTATVDEWARHFARWELGARDLAAGVELAYEEHGSGFKPLPKDIVDFARKVRRERAERENADPELRRAREDAADRRLEARKLALQSAVHTLASGKAVPPLDYAGRQKAPPE